jgi:uncharacterized protein (TIGR02444 family)
MVDPTNFWQYSQSLYNQKVVASTCLSLQESHDLDVNLILFCCWYARNFGVISEALLADSLKYSKSWRRNVVLPIRSTRIWMKSHLENTENSDYLIVKALRERIKFDELTAEKIQQEYLAEIASNYLATNEIALEKTEKSEQQNAAITNIRQLLSTLSIGFDSNIEVSIKLIVDSF